MLIVLTTLPGVSLDNELLAVLAVGGPVGLGTYLAWVNQIWPVPTRVRGLVAALAGGLVGAWLGFNATGGLPAVITATVGTAAGANLALIFLDVYEARRGRRHVTSALSVGPEGESIRV